MTRPIIAQSLLKEILNYDPETGIFTRRIDQRVRKAGAIAGHKDQYGYIIIHVEGYLYRAHHLAWLYMTSNWPVDQIDHINGVRDDNRFVNLREASSTLNRENQHKGGSKNTTGFLGVSKRNGKFRATITIKKKTIDLGLRDTPEEAHELYLIAKRKLHKGCTI